jgi:hypothetical protein
MGERSTSAVNVASVTVTGAPPRGSGRLHRPQTGARPRSTLAQGTRLTAPHAGHGTMRASEEASRSIVRGARDSVNCDGGLAPARAHGLR